MNSGSSEETTSTYSSASGSEAVAAQPVKERLVVDRKQKSHHHHKVVKRHAASSVRVVGSLQPPDQAKPTFLALLQAVNAGDLDGTRAAIQQCPNVVAYVSELGEAPAHAAIVQRNVAPLVALLEAGANPNQRNGEKKPPLYLAVECGNIEAAKVLLEYGADPSLDWTNPAGRRETALFLACIEGDVEMVRALLSACTESDVNHVVREVGAREVATDSVVRLTASKSVVIEYSHKALAGRRLRESLAHGAGEEEEEEDPADQDEDGISDMLFAEIAGDGPGHPLRVARSAPELAAPSNNDGEPIISDFKSILQMTTNEEIKEMLVAHGATTAQGFACRWIAAHATASMSAFCRDLQLTCRAAVPSHPLLLVPGLCSSVLECWQSISRPDWIGGRIWLSIQKMGLPATLR